MGAVVRFGWLGGQMGLRHTHTHTHDPKHSERGRGIKSTNYFGIFVDF